MKNEKKDTQSPKSEEDKTSSDENQKNENDKGLDKKTLLIQKKKMREQRDKLKGELSKLKEEHTKKSKGDDSSDSNSQEQPKEGISKRVQALEFSQKHPELDSKVANDVLEFAEAKGISPDKALENDIIKPYIDTAKEKAEVANATPNSNRSPKVKPEKPVKEMTEEEHKKYWKKEQGL